MNYYYVVAEAGDFKMEDEIRADDLYQLAQFVRETIAYHRDGVRDTSAADCSHIKFTYKLVLDEDEIDVTAEAAAAA